MSINFVAASGNIGGEPTLRATSSGTQILNFSLAINDRVKDPQTGEWTDRANWVTCVIFGARAEKLANYLHKGDKVAVSGRLRYSSWETQDGQKRSKLEVVVDEVEFFAQKKPQNPPAQNITEQDVANGLYAEDIPF